MKLEELLLNCLASCSGPSRPARIFNREETLFICRELGIKLNKNQIGLTRSYLEVRSICRGIVSTPTGEYLVMNYSVGDQWKSKNIDKCRDTAYKYFLKKSIYDITGSIKN